MSLNLNILQYNNSVNSTLNIVYKDIHLDIEKKYTRNSELYKTNEVTDIVADINTESINDTDIDYKYDNSFLGFDWGETFTNAEFLDKKPLIVAYEKETDSLVFCQKSEYGVMNRK